MEWSLFSEPRRFSPPVSAAFGMALSFYPGVGFICWALAMAVFVASFGTAIGQLGGRAVRLRRMQALAAAMGLVAGTSLAWYEGGFATAGAPETDAPGTGASMSMALVRTAPSWAEGRLSTDSRPARNGFRSYALGIERLGLAGRGVSAELSFPGKPCRQTLRVLARGGRAIDAGSLIRARGSLSDGAERSVLFAQSRDIAVIDRGDRIDRARSAIRDACRRALARIGKRSAGLLQALILGVMDSLAPEEAEAFKAAGCSHILALSGEHLSVLAILSIAALKPLFGPIRARFGGAILACLFMWIAGPGPSLARAVLMTWIGAVTLAIDRPQASLSSLALAFLVMLPFDPTGSRSLGFTLSFAAVWGLAVLGPRFSFLLGRRLPPFLRQPASISLAAQTAVSPLLAFSFGYLQFAGIFASMAAGPIVMVLMWWGIGSGLVCSLFPFAAPFAIPVSDFLYLLLMGIMNTAADLPRLLLSSYLQRGIASAAVAGLAALVYARPHAEYRSWLTRLRLSPGPSGPSRGGGPGSVQALRPELPRGQVRERESAG
jgi:competence protein ComEC